MGRASQTELMCVGVWVAVCVGGCWVRENLALAREVNNSSYFPNKHICCSVLFFHKGCGLGTLIIVLFYLFFNASDFFTDLAH